MDQSEMSITGQTEARGQHAALQLLFAARGPFITIQNFHEIIVSTRFLIEYSIMITERIALIRMSTMIKNIKMEKNVLHKN